jgi:hypothetical protein
MPTTKDEYPLEHFWVTSPTNRSEKALARGDRTGVRMIRMPSGRNTASKLAVNLVPRSRTRHRGRVGPVTATMRFRAYWVTHEPVGLEVEVANETRRVSSSIQT